MFLINPCGPAVFLKGDRMLDIELVWTIRQWYQSKSNQSSFQPWWLLEYEKKIWKTFITPNDSNFSNDSWSIHEIVFIIFVRTTLKVQLEAPKPALTEPESKLAF